MKTATIKYFDEEEQLIRDYIYSYPADRELLEIFPEVENSRLEKRRG